MITTYHNLFVILCSINSNLRHWNSHAYFKCENILFPTVIPWWWSWIWCTVRSLDTRTIFLRQCITLNLLIFRLSSLWLLMFPCGQWMQRVTAVAVNSCSVLSPLWLKKKSSCPCSFIPGIILLAWMENFKAFWWMSTWVKKALNSRKCLPPKIADTVL